MAEETLQTLQEILVQTKKEARFSRMIALIMLAILILLIIVMFMLDAMVDLARLSSC